MSVILEIAAYLQPFVGNNDRVIVHGATVRECLNELIFQYPDIEEWLFDIHGTLKTIIAVKHRIITIKDLDSKVSGNDPIRIIMPLGGG